MYEVAVFIHILAGIAWFGGGMFHQLHMNRLRASNGQEAVAAQEETFEWAEKWVFIPAPLLVLATGIIMVTVNDAWAFSQPWVYLALGLWVLEAIMGGAVAGRLVSRIKETRAAGGDLTLLVDRYLALSWIDVAILTVVLVLMVFKPGV
jgi:uncharacterized membrane protein